jgi:hypothetical protein
MGAGNTTIRAMAAGFRTISVAIKDRRNEKVGVCHGRSIRRPPGGDRGGVRRVAIRGGRGPVWFYPGQAMPLPAWRTEVVMSADIGV